MTYRFPWWAGAFALGVYVLQQQARLPGALLYWLTASLLVLLVVIHFKKNQLNLVSMAFMTLMAAALGASWAQWRAEWRLSDKLDPAFEMKEVRITGVVRGIPVTSAGLNSSGLRFQFEVEQAPPGIPGLLSLTWYPRSAETAVPRLQAGARWQLTVRLKRPHGLYNPHGFDVERWMLEQGLRASGTVRNTETPLLVQPWTWSVSSVLDRARQHAGESILSALAPSAYAGVIAALVMGEQRYVEQDDWTLFNRTGIGHLLSISGLHITMLAALMSALGWKVWRWAVWRRQAWAMRTVGLKVAAIAGVMTALLYTLMAGFGVPAQRTLYMLCAVALAILTSKATRPFHVLSLALMVVLLLDPWAVGSAGFWLSFSAVAFLMLAVPMSQDNSWKGQLQTASRAQLAVTVGLLPVTLWFFQQVSLISPVANAVAIPVVSFLVTPLALLGSLILVLTGWDLPLECADTLLQLLMQIMTFMGRWEWAAVEFAVPALGWIWLGFVGACCLFMPNRPGWQRVLGILAMLPMFLTSTPKLPTHSLEAWALDVGQGSAILLRTRHHSLLYDTGPVWSEQADAGARIVLPYLRAVGLRRLDRVLVSHDDGDHSGGALSIMAARQVDEVMGSLPEGHDIQRQARRFVACESGQRWEWDGVQFEILHPHDETLASNDNGLSCVLKVSASGHSLLLTGDIEALQERQLVREQSADSLRATVMLMPHHGSQSSSSELFLDVVKPQAAIAQAGYLNRFQHPRPQVLDRYHDRGAQVWRTDLQGAVRVYFSPSGWKIESQRQLEPRYWHGF
ncbi:MAG: DNA internalization-related competence protein ComEC/Rec2 [Burkholderiales bacterium]